MNVAGYGGAPSNRFVNLLPVDLLSAGGAAADCGHGANGKHLNSTHVTSSSIALLCSLSLDQSSAQSCRHSRKHPKQEQNYPSAAAGGERQNHAHLEPEDRDSGCNGKGEREGVHAGKARRIE